MITVYIDLHPVTGELISPAHSFYNRVGGPVNTVVGYVKKFIIVKDLELGRLGGSLTFIGLPLYKITTPFNGVPYFFGRNAVEYNSTCQPLCVILFFFDDSIGRVGICSCEY